MAITLLLNFKKLKQTDLNTQRIVTFVINLTPVIDPFFIISTIHCVLQNILTASCD
jgi:hypothetical protein